MTKEKFLNIEIEEPPVELQLSVEMRVREILKSDDVVGIKKYWHTFDKTPDETRCIFSKLIR